MIFTQKMYKYLALLTLSETFSRFYGWSEKEQKIINFLLHDSKKNLTEKEKRFALYRLRKMKNNYHEDVLYSLGKMYWHELHDRDEYLYPPIEYEEKTYDIWTKAARLKKSVEMVYDSTTSGITKRIIDPYKTNTPYGEGFCHLKKDIRKFRFDRIIEIKLLDKSFIKPKDWQNKK